MPHLEATGVENGQLVPLVVAGEVEDDAGGADDELDVGLPEQLDQRPDQALQVADVVGRVREVPEGPDAVELGLVARRAEVLGDGVDAARPYTYKSRCDKS